MRVGGSATGSQFSQAQAYRQAVSQPRQTSVLPDSSPWSAASRLSSSSRALVHVGDEQLARATLTIDARPPTAAQAGTGTASSLTQPLTALISLFPPPLASFDHVLCVYAPTYLPRTVGDVPPTSAGSPNPGSRFCEEPLRLRPEGPPCGPVCSRLMCLRARRAREAC